MKPAPAYDIWSDSYDNQNDNLLIVLDDDMVARLLGSVLLADRTVADIGCGTGRHWRRIFAQNPARLVGYDVSAGMLRHLKHKFPEATVHLLSGDNLLGTPDEAYDVIISTLTLGYIADAGSALSEWCRVLKPGGDLIVTDFHPDAAAKGNRSFRHGNKNISIRHYVHSLTAIRAIAERNRLEVVQFDERVVDDSIRWFYEANDALALFEATKAVALVYGFHFRRRDRQ